MKGTEKMKNVYLIITLVLLLSFLLMPLLAVNNSNDSTAPKNESSFKENLIMDTVSNFKVYLSEEKTTVSLSVDEYLLGVLAAEMSVNYHDEALKAQTVAAFTFAYRKHLLNKSSTGETGEYDLTDNTALDQGYIDAKARKDKWGDKTPDYEAKLKKIIDEVKNQVIVYAGEPILAVYHAISPGNTETAKNVWGSDYAYLQSESSVGDLLAPDYLSEVKVSVQDFKNKLTEFGCTVSGEAAKFIGNTQKSTAGTVLKITLCGKEFSGAEIREAFSLRSAAFDLAFKDDEFVFSVTGYGHGVGMSQFGADYLARQGSEYTEILAAYYRGISIVKI